MKKFKRDLEMQPILDNFIFQFLENLFSTLHPSLGNVNLGANARFPCVENVLEPNSFPKKKRRVRVLR